MGALLPAASGGGGGARATAPKAKGSGKAAGIDPVFGKGGKGAVDGMRPDTPWPLPFGARHAFELPFRDEDEQAIRMDSDWHEVSMLDLGH